MTAPRPHWTTAKVHDTLPTDVDAHAVGGLIDVYIDTNSPTHQRIRLTHDQAVKLVSRITSQLAQDIKRGSQ